MNTGIVLVTHTGIGQAMSAIAREINPEASTRLQLVEVALDADLEVSHAAVQSAIAHADEGQGVLLLTDLTGATPHNVALAAAGQHWPTVPGLNLSMLLRALNYRAKAPEEVARLAVEGGRRGIWPDRDH